jgi:hypothetical protein
MASPGRQRDDRGLRAHVDGGTRVPPPRDIPGAAGSRIGLAREHGATLALVRGRVQTSGPILLRAGFTGYGEERLYRLAV